MRNVHNALSDTMQELELTNQYRDTVTQALDNDRRWIACITKISDPNKMLEFEVIEDMDGDPFVGVLQRVGISRDFMNLIMDTLMDILDDDDDASTISMDSASEQKDDDERLSVHRRR